MKHLAKPFVLFILMITLLLFASCSKDDGPEPKEEIAEQIKEEPVKEEEPEEQQPEEEVAPAEEHGTETSDKIACNVSIKGGTRIEGLPPTPNGAITMDLSGAGTEAYLNEGFDIPVISEADVIGAYIQFRAKDEGISTSYYDVNLDDNNAFGAKTAKSFFTKTFKASSLSAKLVNSSLDIDFSPEITPGEFCYLICVYDANGNISAPQEVCVTVNSWGGNDALVGEWHYTKAETYSFDEATEVREVGTESCSLRAFECTNGSTLEYDYCTTKQYETFTFNTDGTYTHTYGHVRSEINADAADVNCEIVYKDTSLSFVINGNWSYDTEKEQMIIVEYELNYDGSSGPFMETYEPGEGFLFDLPNLVVQDDVFSWGYPLGTDLNGDGEVNADDGGYADFYEKQ